MDFASVALNGVPLIMVIMGLVGFLKSLGVKGNWLLGSSLLLGLVFGGSYFFISTPPAEDVQLFGYWFGVIVYGLGMGISTSGLYDTGKSLIGSGLRDFSS